MFKFFKKKEKVKTIYKIIFCDENDNNTKFGEWHEEFKNYESALYRITSKICGWGCAIQKKENDGYKIDDGWLRIEKIEKKC